MFRVGAAFATTALMLVFAVPALANAPDPTSTTVDQVIVNADGSRTVTVEGTWSWPVSSEKNCPADRNGVGYQVDWFDNTANPVGKTNSPAGILYAGDATDNIVHSLKTLGGEGVPSSYLTHNTTNSTPTTTDASNWSSNCGTTNAAGSTGAWGPITHTYSATFTGPIKLCPLMYDPHGTAVNKGGGGSGKGDITAGGTGHNGDNSYEGNGTLPAGNICPTVTIPTLTTSATSNTAGNNIHDTATLTGSGSDPTGSITFKLYPTSASCTGAALYSNTVAATADGDYLSGDFAPTSVGTYEWQATYSSSTISGIVSSCSDTNEQSTISQAQPSISTSPDGSATVGDKINDSATLSGGDNPGGKITWTLFTDSGCTNQVDSEQATVTGAGTYSTPTGYDTTSTGPGTYYWIATYSGDTNNHSVASNCGDEKTTVTAHGLSIVTDSTSGTVGDTITDKATLSGGLSPTGTITWTLFSDSSCDPADQVDTESVSVNGNGDYFTPTGYTTTAAGKYYWIADYSGDGNNNSVSTSCGDPGEISTAAPAQPAIVTLAKTGKTVGDQISDRATLSGGFSPTGTITWKVYSDSACTHQVNSESVPVSNGNGTYTSPGFTPTSAGTYHWVAKYSGDSNNQSVSTNCSDPDEQSTVSPRQTPAIKVIKLASVHCSALSQQASQPSGTLPCNGTWTPYTRGVLTVEVPFSGSYSIPIRYQIRVTNTGNTPLTLSLDDALCDPGTISGPVKVSGTLTGKTLSAGGRAYYTCRHTLTQNDPNKSATGQPFTNTATVTGKPPHGTPVHGHGKVTVDRKPKPQAVHFCRSFKTGKRISFTGHKEPKACKPPKPHHGRGFTG